MGHKIFITGASSGIGKALALELAREGHLLVLAARRKSELEATALEVKKAGGQALVQVLDVGDAAKTVDVIRQLDAELGGFDTIIANAGIGAMGSGRKLTWEKIDLLLRVNFNGSIATLTAVLPQMVERRRGHLVAISSLSAYTPLPKAAPYGASKAGLSYFCESLRQDLAGTGVSVTTVHPGFIRTDMIGDDADKRPFVMNADVAARLIVERFEGHPAVIDFPFPTRLGAGLASVLPRFVRSQITKRLV